MSAGSLSYGFSASAGTNTGAGTVRRRQPPAGPRPRAPNRDRRARTFGERFVSIARGRRWSPGLEADQARARARADLERPAVGRAPTCVARATERHLHAAARARGPPPARRPRPAREQEAAGAFAAHDEERPRLARGLARPHGAEPARGTVHPHQRARRAAPPRRGEPDHRAPRHSPSKWIGGSRRPGSFALQRTASTK